MGTGMDLTSCTALLFSIYYLALRDWVLDEFRVALSACLPVFSDYYNHLVKEY